MSATTFSSVRSSSSPSGVLADNLGDRQIEIGGEEEVVGLTVGWVTDDDVTISDGDSGVYIFEGHS